MRLTDTERRALSAALDDVAAPVYLFGSRLDTHRRGGDIDLLILTRGLPVADRFQLSLQVAVRFRSLCDEKIDVQAFDEEQMTPAERAFLATLRMKRIDRAELAA